MNDIEIKLDMIQETIKEVQKDLCTVSAGIPASQTKNKFDFLVGKAIAQLEMVKDTIIESEGLITTKPA